MDDKAKRTNERMNEKLAHFHNNSRTTRARFLILDWSWSGGGNEMSRETCIASQASSYHKRNHGSPRHHFSMSDDVENDGQGLHDTARHLL